jgi:hypothetical protein
MKLYTIHTLRSKYLEDQGRTPAVCTKLETAIELVEGNYGDMYECGYYPYVVIEPFESDTMYGMTQALGEQVWFAWEGTWEEGAYKKIDQAPEGLENICGFGIG